MASSSPRSEVDLSFRQFANRKKNRENRRGLVLTRYSSTQPRIQGIAPGAVLGRPGLPLGTGSNGQITFREVYPNRMLGLHRAADAA